MRGEDFNWAALFGRKKAWPTSGKEGAPTGRGGCTRRREMFGGSGAWNPVGDLSAQNDGNPWGSAPVAGVPEDGLDATATDSAFGAGKFGIWAGTAGVEGLLDEKDDETFGGECKVHSGAKLLLAWILLVFAGSTLL